MSVTCDQCDPPRELANAGALRFHAIAVHDADAGHCDLCNKDFKRLTAHTTRMHKIDPDAATSPSGSGGAASGSNPDEPELELDAERPPTSPFAADDTPPPSSARPRLRDRIGGRLWGNKDDRSSSTSSSATNGAGAYDTPTRERRPRAGLLGKRATTAPLMSMAWGGMGAALERSGADIPVGRTLQLQANMAGEVLDRLIARTWVDRVLQPIAQKTDDVEALAALVALPILVATIERSPAAAVTLEPILRQAIRANLTAMAPVVKKQRAEEKKWAAAVADLDPAFAGDVDPVDIILASIFADPTPRQPADDVDDERAPVG